MNFVDLFFKNQVKLKLVFIFLLFWHLVDHGESGDGSVSVKEGGSVRLDTGVKTNQQQKIRWYFNNIRIAEITGDLSKACTDVQCNEGTVRFRGRLKLDHQTGSLTIMKIRTTDTGVYHLQISSANNSKSEQIFSVTVNDLFSVSTDGVSVFVMERDSVTFQTDVETSQQRRIRWYFNDTLIAHISGDLSKICTDVQCEGGDERFRDRLKLDHQTGSLTITDTRTTDAGFFDLMISSKNNGEKDRTFRFAVHDVSAAAEQDEMMKKEGEHVTLYTGVISQNDLLRWYFNDIPIAEITGDQSEICADDQCKERFRDRLKLDHQTGSLTITNITNTDCGLYQQQINSSRFRIIRNFTVTVTVTVTAVRDLGPPLTTAGGTNTAVISVVVTVLLIAAASVVMYFCKRANQNDTVTGRNEHNEENGNSNGTSANQAVFQLVPEHNSLTSRN